MMITEIKGLNSCSFETISCRHNTMYEISYLLYIHAGLAAGIPTSVLISIATGRWRLDCRFFIHMRILNHEHMLHVKDANESSTYSPLGKKET
jgi:hypothetical protein